MEFLAPGNFVTFTGNVLIDCDIQDCSQIICEYTPKRTTRMAPLGGGESVTPARRTSSYGQGALDGECRRIRQAHVGSRTCTIYGASKNIGELIAGGEIKESDAIRELEQAGKATGQPANKLRRNIEDGIKDGKQKPRMKT